LWLRWRDVPRVPATIAALMAAGLLGLGVMGAPETLAIPAAFAAILLLLALTSDHPRNPLESRALHWLGEISYATYLGHYLLWSVFKIAFVDDAYAVPPGLIALYLGMVLASSAFLYTFIERPAQRWINGWRQPRPVSA
jgi:peptidoglycan/LPS O-acetylase OafA/YrhL